MRAPLLRWTLFSCLLATVVWAGLEWGRHRWAPRADLDLHRTRLALGQVFPEVLLTAPSGQRISTASLRGTPTVICLLAIGCDPCAAAVDLLLESEIPAGTQVIGICPQGHDRLDEYRAALELPYELYADEDQVLAHQYGCERFPAAIALRADGTIALIREGLAGFQAALNELPMITTTTTSRAVWPAGPNGRFAKEGR